MDNFRLFLQQMDKTTDFPLHYEHMVNRLRKIVCSYIRKTELTEIGNFRLFVCCKRKMETATFVCLLQTETENRSLFSLVGKQ
jgi:hypothetical protein